MTPAQSSRLAPARMSAICRHRAACAPRCDRARGLGFVRVALEAASPVVNAKDDDLPCCSTHLKENCRASPKANGPQSRPEVVALGSAFWCLGKTEAKAFYALDEAECDVVAQARGNVVVNRTKIRLGGVADDNRIRLQPR